MSLNRLPSKDPRTVARDIPGIFDTIFPQLVSGVVAYLNRTKFSPPGCKEIPYDLVKASGLSRAMLFEIAVARAEQIITNNTQDVDWDVCLEVALERQRRHFDAKLPKKLEEADKVVAKWVANNLSMMLNSIQEKDRDHPLIPSPLVPGYQWIASGNGDFAIGPRIIEVKCTNKNFSAADYRQIIMYWILSYASSIETGSSEWIGGILVNPRLNYIVEFSFDEIITIIGSGRSKLELYELFSSIVGEHTLRMLSSITFNKEMTDI